MTGAWRLVDEGSRPTLRERLGRELVQARTADFAVARIRLAALDLTEEELAGTGQWRVLLGELDAAMLLDASEGARRALAGDAPARLRRFAASGRLEVRSAGLGSWSPDFAVVRTEDGVLCAVGAIYFGSPRLAVGPSLTVLTRDGGAASRAAARFDELWEKAHDVLPAITEVLERAGGRDREEEEEEEKVAAAAAGAAEEEEESRTPRPRRGASGGPAVGRNRGG